ncbi:hypothetical protein KP509_02G055800 [Ceratopteris richardii]|nr:hypothetical protein KP509_02G055800 [Ceratopteris richardii]
MAVGHLVLALALPGTIYAAVFFTATGFGSQWAVFPTATSELFGLRNFGVLYNLVAIASPAGSIIYSTFMAGPIYDWQASKQGSSSCEGTVCFEITFFAMAAACILATALSIVLSARTRFLYAVTRHALR